MTKGTGTRRDFGPLEAEVMAALWEAGGRATVRTVIDSLNRDRPEPLAYTTVMTVMSRLAEKEVLRRHRAGRGYLYEATAPDAAGLAVHDVMRTYGDVALAHFIDVARADPALLRRLRKMLEAEGG